jgi:hypothetical protein
MNFGKSDVSRVEGFSRIPQHFVAIYLMLNLIFVATLISHIRFFYYPYNKTFYCYHLVQSGISKTPNISTPHFREPRKMTISPLLPCLYPSAGRQLRKQPAQAIPCFLS